jgi:hypothetical protein
MDSQERKLVLKSFAGSEEKSYEMNKCLSLVHLTTNFLAEKQPSRDFPGLPQNP